MATPKTPFRTRQARAPMVVGVVSSDSQDVAPQPSPVKIPTPQVRPAVDDTPHSGSYAGKTQPAPPQDLVELQSLEDGSLSSCDNQMTRPPSPYSPPAESLWSAATEDQWPVTHTKRQFQAHNTSNIKAAPTPTLAPPDWNHHNTGEPTYGTVRTSIPPQAPTPYHHHHPLARTRISTTPALSRRSDNVTATTTNDAQALFLLQEEHRLWQEDYHRLNQEWQDICDDLQHKVIKQDDLMAVLQERLNQRNEEIEHTKEALIQAHAKLEAQLATQLQVSEQDEAHQKLQSDYHNLLQEYSSLQETMQALQKSAAQEKEQLQAQLQDLRAKKDQYEQEIAKQSKRILELEEEQGNNDPHWWEAEKQALDQEIRSLRERLSAKDTDEVKLQNLEKQVHSLTNALTEYQGRHKELRVTVDQHLQKKEIQSIACQTESSTAGSSTPAAATIATDCAIDPHDDSPPTRSVRFDPAGVPMSAIRHPPASPLVHSLSSEKIMHSPSFSEQAVHCGPVSPWISTWPGRNLTLRTPADPPSLFHPPSARPISPPAKKYTMDASEVTPRPIYPSVSTVHDHQDDNRSAATPATAKTSNAGRASRRRTPPLDQVSHAIVVVVVYAMQKYYNATNTLSHCTRISFSVSRQGPIDTGRGKDSLGSWRSRHTRVPGKHHSGFA